MTPGRIIGFCLLVVALVCPAVADEKFDATTIFKQSKTYRRIAATNPGTVKLLEGETTENYREFAVFEDHPTHIVTLARLRLYANGGIRFLDLGSDLEEVWRNDKLRVKRHIKIGRKR